jgi:membrane protein insertase Oxa1/YidC/SpoIIIJ
MQFYNKIMLYFWLLLAIAIFFFISYMSYTDGLKKWGYNYIFVVVAVVMYLFRRWMMKRMAKHMAYLAEQAELHQKK